MKIKVNGIEKTVLPVSQLTFRQFNSIIIKNEVSDLKSYLPLFLGIPKDDFLESKMDCASIPMLHSFVFDVDIERCIKEKRETLTYLGEIYYVKDLDIDTFGKSYLFELKKQGDHDPNELSVYLLSLALCKSNDASDVEIIFEDLKNTNWMDITPQGFFLLKNISKRNLISKRLLAVYIWGLKKINLKTAFSLRKYLKSQKKLSQGSCVRDLI